MCISNELHNGQQSKLKRIKKSNFTVLYSPFLLSAWNCAFTQSKAAWIICCRHILILGWTTQSLILTIANFGSSLFSNNLKRALIKGEKNLVLTDKWRLIMVKVNFQQTHFYLVYFFFSWTLILLIFLPYSCSHLYLFSRIFCCKTKYTNESTYYCLIAKLQHPLVAFCSKFRAY